MRNKVVWKGGTLLAPIPPVMVSVGTVDKPNVLTVAWTGIINTIPPKTYISIRPERFSYNILKEIGEFVINLPCVSLVRAVDFCGVRSGKDVDKFKEMSLTAIPANDVRAPLIDECPINLECRITQIIEMGTHHMFIADILKVNVSAEVIDKNGKLCIEKCDLLAFAHGEYFSLGKKVGSFGYSVRKNKNKRIHQKRKKD